MFFLKTEVKWAVLVVFSSTLHTSSTEESWHRKEGTRQKGKRAAVFRQVIPCYWKMGHFHSKPDSFPLLVSPVRSSLSSSLIPHSFHLPIQIVIGKINGRREKLLFWWWHLWDKQKISTAANTKVFLSFDPNLQSSFPLFLFHSLAHFSFTQNS